MTEINVSTSRPSMSEVFICHWDLLNAREEMSPYQETIAEDMIAKENVLFTVFSPDLTQMIRLSLSLDEGDGGRGEQRHESRDGDKNGDKGQRDEINEFKDIKGIGRAWSSADTAGEIADASLAALSSDGNVTHRSLTEITSTLERGMYRLGSITPDGMSNRSPSPCISASRQDFYDSNTWDDKFNRDSVNETKNQPPPSEEMDRPERSDSQSKQVKIVVNESEDDNFVINTVLSWNTIILRNQEYAMEAQKKSRSNSRISLYERKGSKSLSKDISPSKVYAKQDKMETPLADSSAEKAKANTDTDNDTGHNVGEKDTGNNPKSDKTTRAEAGTDGSTKITITGAGGTERGESATEDSDSMAGDENEEMNSNSCVLAKIEPSAISFVNEDNVLIGTNSSHVLLLNIPTFKVATVLTSDEPRLVPVPRAGISLADVESPHKGAINFVGSSEDGSKLVSADAKVVCLWNTADRTLAMTINVDEGQEVRKLILLIH